MRQTSNRIQKNRALLLARGSAVRMQPTSATPLHFLLSLSLSLALSTR